MRFKLDLDGDQLPHLAVLWDVEGDRGADENDERVSGDRRQPRDALHPTTSRLVGDGVDAAEVRKSLKTINVLNTFITSCSSNASNTCNTDYTNSSSSNTSSSCYANSTKSSYINTSSSSFAINTSKKITTSFFQLHLLKSFTSFSSVTSII